ncbi:hypothetical protein ACEPAF_3516 [Sanghuangporus sanghuang]|uniref:Uncharacterized protein n=1 Tax=Sanghuangporus baumii TaxID=108892 RepID=A0A9Q5HYQ2_SANBA|nr:hypothetical protein A7U60_g4512 [Sanghuangporus baumii]
MTPNSDPRSLLGSTPSSEQLTDYLNQLAHLTSSKQVPNPEIKSYSDALYMTYYPLGVSLMFVDKNGSKSIKGIDAQSENLVLDSIDIYNPEQEEAKEDAKPSKGSTVSGQVYAPYPANLVLLLLPGTVNNKPRPPELTITSSSTGKDLLINLGEPDRKGGGAGPSSGSISIWCEWSKDGVMIEFGGPDAKGPHAWERGKDAKWRVVTLFRLKAA